MSGWSTGLPVLVPVDEDEYGRVALVWASRITRSSPPYARHLLQRCELLVAALADALEALEAGSLRREGRDGL